MKIVLVLQILTLITCTLYAQVQEDLSPTEKRFVTPVTEPITAYKGFVRTGISSSFSIVDRMFDASGKNNLLESNVSGYVISTSIYLQYGITDRLQFEFEIPYQYSKSTLSTLFELYSIDSTYAVVYNKPSKGISDLTATLGYQLLKGSYTNPYLGVFIKTTAPTAKTEPKVSPDNPNETIYPTGRGELRIQASLRFRKIIFPNSYEFTTSYEYAFGGKKMLDATDTVKTTFKGSNQLSLQASWNNHLSNWIIFKSNFYLFFFGKSKKGEVSSDTSWQIGINPGFIFQRKAFRFGLGLICPLAGKSTTANVGYVSNLTYIF